MALGPPLREKTKRKRIVEVEEEGVTEGLIIECEQLMAGDVLAAAKSKWRQRRQQSAELNNGDSHVGTHPTAAFAAVGAPTALGGTGVVVVPAVLPVATAGAARAHVRATPLLPLTPIACPSGCVVGRRVNDDDVVETMV